MTPDQFSRELERELFKHHVSPKEADQLRKLYEYRQRVSEAGNQSWRVMREELRAAGDFVKHDDVARLWRTEARVAMRLNRVKEGVRLANEMRRTAPFGIFSFLVRAYGGLLMMLLVALLLIGLFVLAQADRKGAQVASKIYCDCTHVPQDLLTKESQEDCRARESEMLERTKECGNNLECIRAALNLKIDRDGLLQGTNTCRLAPYGGAAWPVEGGSAVPPPRGPEGRPCLEVYGLTRECG